MFEIYGLTSLFVVVVVVCSIKIKIKYNRIRTYTIAIKIDKKIQNIIQKYTKSNIKNTKTQKLKKFSETKVMDIL